MSWFDSSSFTGLLNQAQKSIDRVLDIQNEDKSTDSKSKDLQPTKRETKISKEKSQDSETKQDTSSSGLSDSSQGSPNRSAKVEDKKSKAARGELRKKEQINKTDNTETTKVSNTSWLSGEDSFWGSYTEEAKVEDKREGVRRKEDAKKDVGTVESKQKEVERVQKESKSLSKKSLSVKNESSTKKISEKSEAKKSKVASGVKLERSKKESSTQLSKSKNVKEISGKENDIKKSVEKDLETFTKEKQPSLTKEKVPSSLKVKSEKHVVGIDISKSSSKSKATDLNEGGSKIVKSDAPDVLVKNSTEQKTNNVSDRLQLEKALIDTNTEVYEKSPTKVILNEEDQLKTEGTQNNEITSNIEKDMMIVTPVKLKTNFDTGIKNLTEINLDEIKISEADSFCSIPVASSTPCTERTRQTLTSVSSEFEGDESIDIPSSRKNLMEVIETSEGVNKSLGDIESENADTHSEHSELKDENLSKVFGENAENGKSDGESKLRKETERLQQVIDVRESKLVSLSKENLDLQETNSILRSQLEQLEQVHQTEDDEFNEMKEEFKKRISNAESKLQVAAKERDLYKKQLEETQQCLNSDIERQLKEFQLLSQQKDQQIVDLMEEGEKLSKEVLQRSNNIKKLRAKEKETSEENEKQRVRLEAAESEIERLTEILRGRDEHEKEQDDAIKKLNAYILKQDQQLAKQKVELEETSSKMPNLQSALDNAYKEITELHKVNAAKSNAVQEATLSVEMNAKEELRLAMEKLKKESEKSCDVLALEVMDMQTQMSRSEQQAARREDNLRQEIEDVHLRLQEAESRNQELTQSVSAATRPLLRQIENLQHSYGSQETSWEKLEKNLTERLAGAQSQQASAQEKERAATEKSLELSSRVASLESQVGSYRQEKSRLEAEMEIEKAKLDALEEYKSRETGKIAALKTAHSKELETVLLEKNLLEQQLLVERTKLESEQKKASYLDEQLKTQKLDLHSSRSNYDKENEDDVFERGSATKSRSRNTSLSSQNSFTENINRSIPNGSTAIFEELRATIRHKEGELTSMETTILTLENGRESLTKELTTLMTANEELLDENRKLSRQGQTFQDLQGKYNALLQMYGEKQEETEELKLDLQDIKMMYKAQIQELLNAR